MSHGRFITAINCMDGRTQEPLIKWARKKYGVDYVDMINEPGPDKLLLTEDKALLEYTIKKIRISTDKHGSRRLIIVGHWDCAGNPVDRPQHLEEVKKSIQVARRLLPDIEIEGVYINEQWEVEEIY